MFFNKNFPKGVRKYEENARRVERMAIELAEQEIVAIEEENKQEIPA